MKNVFRIFSVFVVFTLFFLFLRSASSLPAFADGQCVGSYSSSRCASSNPDPYNCIPHELCSGGNEPYHYCCRANPVTTPTPTLAPPLPTITFDPTNANCSDRKGHCPNVQYPDCIDNIPYTNCSGNNQCRIPYYTPMGTNPPYNLVSCASITGLPADCSVDGDAYECKDWDPGSNRLCPENYEPNAVGDVGELGCGAFQVCCKQLSLRCERKFAGCSLGKSQCPNEPLVCCINMNECPSGTNVWPTIPVYNPECTTDNGQEGVKTALGCLPTDPEIFVNTALPWAIGVGAGIAFLLGLFGAIIIVLSAGNPEKMQAGKEMITSAIAGLLLIIFAVLILNVVGVKVLNLFDFQEPPHPGDGGT